jgi:hypothetical protein
VFQKAIHANGEKHDANIVELVLFHLKGCKFGMGQKLYVVSFGLHISKVGGYILLSVITRFKMTNMFTWPLESSCKVVMKRLKFTMNKSSNLSTTFNIRWMTIC